ncbi:MAG: hypothetical protein AAFR11_00060 [Pseudomonadota bacterium]
MVAMIPAAAFAFPLVALFVFAFAGDRVPGGSRAGRAGFSMRNLVVIVGDREMDEACRMQRRRLKPIVGQLREAGAGVVEIYGRDIVRLNGVNAPWLDAELLRAVIGAEDGFRVVRFDRYGRQSIASARPLAMNDLLAGPSAFETVATSTIRPANEAFPALAAA